jgi:hypothetical protein
MSEPQGITKEIPAQDTKWTAQRIQWPVVGGYILAALSLVPELVPQITPYLPEGKTTRILQTAAIVCGLLAARFGRTATAEGYNLLAPALKAVEAKADRAQARVERIVERAAQNESGFTADLIREGTGTGNPTTLTPAPPSTPFPGSQAEDRSRRGERA